MQLGEATPADLARDVQLALDANLDLLRLHAHVSRPELYDAADDAGLLLWQDFPLQWGYARGVRKPAVRQARRWSTSSATTRASCFGVRTTSRSRSTSRRESRSRRPSPSCGWAARCAADLEQERARPLGHTRAAPRRPESRRRPALGVLPGLGGPGTDTHFYFGWYHGKIDGLAPAVAGCPAPRPFRDRVRRPGRARVGRVHGARAVAEARLGPLVRATTRARSASSTGSCRPRTSRPSTSGARATQEYQAALVQLQVEDLRRLKYRPPAGFCHFCFADGHPAVTWSVLDHERAREGSVTRRCATRAGRCCRCSSRANGLVHVASERRDDLAGAVVEVTADGGPLGRVAPVTSPPTRITYRRARRSRRRRRRRPSPWSTLRSGGSRTATTTPCSLRSGSEARR